MKVRLFLRWKGQTDEDIISTEIEVDDDSMPSDLLGKVDELICDEFDFGYEITEPGQEIIVLNSDELTNETVDIPEV